MRRPLTFRNVNLSGSSSDGESTQTNTNGTSNNNIGTGITSDHSHSNSLSSQFIKTTQAMIARVSNVHGRNSTASISAQSGPRTSQLILPRSIKKRLKLVFIMTFAAALIFYQDTLTFSSNGSSNSKHNHHYSSVYSNSKHGGTNSNSNGGGGIHIRKSSSMLGSSRTLRQGNLQIAKTPYVSPKQALNEMPPLDNGNKNGNGNGKMPSHLALCQELIQRNNVSYQHKEAAAARARNLNAQNMDMDNNQNAMGNGNGLEDLGLPPPPVFTKFTVHESSELCKDYKHPHSAIMQIISSSIIAYVGKRFGLNYVHNCHSTIKLDGHGDGNDLDFDITTVQQVFPQATMPVNERELKLGHVVHSLCQSCIHEYHNDHQRRERQMQMNANANVDVNGPDGILDPHQKAHHCLSFPLLQNVHEDTIRVQQVNQEHPDMPEIHLEQHILDQEGHLVRTGLAAVLPLVRNRLNHAAMDWANRARIPSHDPRSGAVIYLDAGDSMAVPFWVIQKYVKQDATHVSILSGPDCARETLKGHISCIQYVLGK